MEIIDQKYKIIKIFQSNSKGGVALVKRIEDEQLLGLKYTMSQYRKQKPNLEREFKLMNKINDRNVTKVYDYIENGKYQTKNNQIIIIDYYTMEYAQEGDLFNLIEKYQEFQEKIKKEDNPLDKHQSSEQESIWIEIKEQIKQSQFLPLWLVKYLAQEVGNQMISLHSCYNICHMDLKLENILVRDNMDLALSDFGFSLRSDEDTNHFLGTEYYIAPEVYINRNPYLKQLYSPVKADAFSFGVLLFTCLFGQFPWTKPDLSDKHYRLFLNNRQAFWTQFNLNQNSQIQQIINLLDQLLNPDYNQRISIDQFMQIIQNDQGDKDAFLNKKFNQAIMHLILNSHSITDIKKTLQQQYLSFNHFQIEHFLQSHQ